MNIKDIEELNLRLEESPSLLKEISYFTSLDSSNSYLKRNLDSYASGHIILAGSQSQGRGRLARKWSSSCQGGLYFSLLFKNKWDLKDLNFLTLLVATSIDRSLKELGFKSLIKWPNDIYINNKKIAGILTENIITSYNNTIIGIGVNVNNRGFDPELVDKASSLYLEGGPVDKKALFTSILNNINRDLMAYAKDFEKETFISYIKKNSLNLKKDIQVQLAGGFIEGRMEDILEDGSLKILDKKNHSHIINYGEIINQ